LTLFLDLSYAFAEQDTPRGAATCRPIPTPRYSPAAASGACACQSASIVGVVRIPPATP